MKILIGIILSIGSYLYALDGFDINMDKVKYYDADKTSNEKLELMSEDLTLFINSTASSELIQKYKDGKLELSEDEKEDAKISQANSIVDTQGTTNTVVKDTKPSFFAKMMEKVGLGSTKTIKEEIVIENNNTKEVQDEK